MSLAPNALISLSDLKTFMSITSAGADTQLERAIGYASQLIESHLDRLVTTQGAITEYHSLEHPSRPDLFLGDWPIISVTSVHEDATRAYDPLTPLVVDTDYIVSSPVGKLIRVQSGAGAFNWLSGFRTVKVVYEAGYLKPGEDEPVGAAAVPADLTQVCAELAATIYQDADRKDWGKTQISTEGRNMTRFLGYLTTDIVERLRPMQRYEMSRTWDRDA